MNKGLRRRYIRKNILAYNLNVRKEDLMNKGLRRNNVAAFFSAFGTQSEKLRPNEEGIGMKVKGERGKGKALTTG